MEMMSNTTTLKVQMQEIVNAQEKLNDDVKDIYRFLQENLKNNQAPEATEPETWQSEHAHTHTHVT